MVNRAQLAASLAALFRQHQLDVILAALFQQHCLTSTKVIKEPQYLIQKMATTCITGGFGAYVSSFRLNVTRAQQAKVPYKKGQKHLSLALNIWWRIGGSNP